MISFSHRRILGMVIAGFILYTQYLQYVFKAIPSMVTILGALVLGIGYIGILNCRKYWSPFEVNEFTMMFFFFAATLVTGFASSPNITVHIRYWITSFTYFLLVPCFMYLIGNKRRLCIFCALYMIFSILCAITLLHNPVVYYERAAEGARYSLSKSLNVNMLGQFFMLGGWGCCLLMNFFPKFQKYGLAIIVLLFYANNLTGSRKNLIAIILTVGLWFVICWMPDNKKNIFKVLLMIIAIISITYYCYIHFYLNSDIAQRMTQIFVSSDGKENGRFDMYRIAVYIFKKYPIFGLGFHGFGLWIGNVNTYSHATYAELLACTGICGSVLFLGMYVYSFVKILVLIIRIRKIEELKDSLVMLKMALILWVIIIFMSSTVIYFYELIGFMVWGILFSIIQITKKDISEYMLERT